MIAEESSILEYSYNRVFTVDASSSAYEGTYNAMQFICFYFIAITNDDFGLLCRK